MSGTTVKELLKHEEKTWKEIQDMMGTIEQLYYLKILKENHQFFMEKVNQ